MPITVLESKLRYSYSFCNARVPNKDRSLNCGRVAAKIARFKSVNSEIIGRKFIKFVHDVARLLPFNEIPGYAPAVDFILILSRSQLSFCMNVHCKKHVNSWLSFTRLVLFYGGGGWWDRPRRLQGIEMFWLWCDVNYCRGWKITMQLALYRRFITKGAREGTIAEGRCSLWWWWVTSIHKREQLL